MKTRFAIFAALLCLSSWTQAETGTPAAAAAHDRYLRDLVDVFSDSGDPRELMFAARFQATARVIDKARRDPEGLARAGIGADAAADSLVRAALRNDPDDPLVWWIVATNCPGSTRVCDVSHAITRLRALDPDNAVVWLLFDRTQTRVRGSEAADPSDDEERLLRIASAARYDTYQREEFRALTEVLAKFPVPDAVIPWAPQHGPPPSSELLQFAFAHAQVMAGSFLGYSEVENLCSLRPQATLEETRRDLCIEALRFVLEHADSVATHQIAARRLQGLLPSGPAREVVTQARRRVGWQFSAWLELEMSEKPDETMPLEVAELERLRRSWLKPGASELDMIRARVEGAGIALEPPLEWRGPWGEAESDGAQN